MQLREHVSLRDKNTYRIGGEAAYYSEPQSALEIQETISWFKDKHIPVLILGKGSNLLISDEGWPGLVINISTSFNKMEWYGNRLVVQSGVLLNAIVNDVIANSYCGIEELAGIPGTAGGAVIMNAGAFSSCIADTVEWVRYYDIDTGAIHTLDNKAMEFGYRHSVLKDKSVIIESVSFVFNKKCIAEELKALRDDILVRRKSKQPLEYPNCGSVFKRPPGKYAGTLIEQCGLKGVSEGGAEISTRHANFIVNKGNATAEDVRKLIAYAQKKVFECSEVLLEPEVIFIGTFKTPLFEKT
jgi:UDP-N-acetylmuramate dehydrogenase